MKKILVIGSANVDFVVGVKEMPEIGETVMSESFKKVPGGKGANQAYACGRLGGDTTFLNVVGNDDLGNVLIENIKKANVKTDAILKTDSASTGMAIVCVDMEGNNNIVVIPGANSCCDIEYLDTNKHLFDESDIVLVQMEIPADSVFYAVRLAKSLNKMVILNPAPVPDYIPDDIYDGLDFLTPNESEFRKLTGCPTDNIDDIVKYSKLLLNKCVKNIIVTLGSRGAMLINQSGYELFEPPEIDVVDTTAAGDTFNAAFARKMADGSTCEDAIKFANYASSLSVSKSGAQSSIPSYNEVLNFINHVECYL